MYYPKVSFTLNAVSCCPFEFNQSPVPPCVTVTNLFLGLSLCVYVRVHMRVHVRVHTCEGQRLTLGGFSTDSPIYILRKSLTEPREYRFGEACW